MRRVGANQLHLLIMLGSPSMILAHATKETPALVRRGLIREDRVSKTAAGYCITPAGLRVLADEMEAGRVEDAIAGMRTAAGKRGCGS